VSGAFSINGAMNKKSFGFYFTFDRDFSYAFEMTNAQLPHPLKGQRKKEQGKSAAFINEIIDYTIQRFNRNRRFLSRKLLRNDNGNYLI